MKTLNYSNKFKKRVGAIIILVFFFCGVWFILFGSMVKSDAVSDNKENKFVSMPEYPVVSSDVKPDINRQEDYSFQKRYTVKEYRGTIGVFEKGEKEPFRKIDINIDDLPNADKKMLKDGINVNTQEELNAVLEDYCS